MWSRTKKTTESLPPPSRFDRWSEGDLINAIEACGQRSGELFRGFNHGELDQAWILAEMGKQLETALACVQTLQRRVATVQTL
jgi:hypothetical protein